MRTHLETTFKQQIQSISLPENIMTTFFWRILKLHNDNKPTGNGDLSHTTDNFCRSSSLRQNISSGRLWRWNHHLGRGTQSRRYIRKVHFNHKISNIWQYHTAIQMLFYLRCVPYTLAIKLQQYWSRITINHLLIWFSCTCSQNGVVVSSSAFLRKDPIWWNRKYFQLSKNISYRPNINQLSTRYVQIISK